MEPPKRIQPKDLADYLDLMSKSVFQTGISWRVVDAKWSGIREAMYQFDPVALSNITLEELDALVEDKRVIRNRRKLEAIANNARRMLELDGTHDGFRNYLRSHAGFEELVKNLRKQFKFLGDMGACHFLWIAGEEVPPYEQWCADRGVKPHGQ